MKTLSQVTGFFLRTTIVCALVMATLIVLDLRREDSYRTVLQPEGTGTRLRRLKRMLGSGPSSKPANEVGKNHELVHGAFRDVVGTANRSTVFVYVAGEQAALGVAIAPDKVITKASEVNGNIECRKPGHPPLKARAQNVDRRYDLAILDVPGGDFEPIRWGSVGSLPIGSWVAVTDARGDEPIVVGVVSAATRAIQRDSAVLGVDIEQTRVLHVYNGSAAEQIGLRVGDVVTHVGGQPVTKQNELIGKIRMYRPGDAVEVQVQRDGQQLTLSAVLGRIDEVRAAEQGFDEHVGGALSVRRSDFPQIIQHDCPLRANQCGGLLVNLDGEAVGLNIARASRVATYSLPAGLVRQRIIELGWNGAERTSKR